MRARLRASHEIEPTCDDVFLFGGRDYATMRMRPIGWPYQAQALCWLGFDLLKEKFGLARVVHIVQIGHEHEMPVHIGRPLAASLSVPRFVAGPRPVILDVYIFSNCPGIRFAAC